jgi:hypothetical protein
MADQPAPPTAEEIAKAQQVGAAGAQAAAETQGTPAEATEAAKGAMHERNAQLGSPFSDEDLDKMADAFVTRTIEQFEQRGVFEQPPEPVQPPATAPPAPGETPPPAPEPPAAPTAEEAPRKKSFAERYFGL